MRAGAANHRVLAHPSSVERAQRHASALLPGGRVDLISARGAEPLPTEGAAIDHIGFSVQDLDAFAAALQRRGIGTEGEGSLPDANLRALFLTDPVGTRIAVTEGLPNPD